MMTLRQVELSRPVCENSFQSQAVVTTNAFIRKAEEWFHRVADDFVNKTSQSWIITVTELQREDPQECFA